MSRNKWIAKEPSNVVETANYKLQRSIHKKLARQNAAIDEEWLEKRKTWVFAPPSPMTVSLYRDSGCVPAGLVLSVPHETGCLILCRRLGSILERDDVAVDVVIEGEIEDAVEALGL
jgi:hypothetical protein